MREPVSMNHAKGEGIGRLLLVAAFVLTALALFSIPAMAVPSILFDEGTANSSVLNRNWVFVNVSASSHHYVIAEINQSKNITLDDPLKVLEIVPRNGVIKDTSRYAAVVESNATDCSFAGFFPATSACYFNGTDSKRYINVSGSYGGAKLNTSNYTVVIAVNLTGYGQGNLGRIIENRGTAGGGWMLGVDSAQGFKLVTQFNGNIINTANNFFAFNEWACIAMVKNSSNDSAVNLYRKNSSFATAAFVETINQPNQLIQSNTKPLYIAIRADDLAREMAGQFGGLGIWNRTLSVEEIDDRCRYYIASNQVNITNWPDNITVTTMKVYANDSAGLWNVTGTRYYSFGNTNFSETPVSATMNVSIPANGQQVGFNATFNDSVVLASCTFSHNMSGTYQNISASFTPLTGLCGQNLTISAPQGTKIAWQFIGCDLLNDCNQTTLQTFNVNTAPTISSLVISSSGPFNDTNANWTKTISASDVDAQNIYNTTWWNSSTKNPLLIEDFNVNNFTDLSGNGINLLGNSSWNSTNGIDGSGAIDFLGKKNYVNKTGLPITNTSNISICFWFKTNFSNSNPSSQSIVRIIEGAPNTGLNRTQIGFDASNPRRIVTRTDTNQSANQAGSSFGSLTDSVYHSICVVWGWNVAASNGTAYHYFDGLNVNNKSLVGTTYYNSPRIELGVSNQEMNFTLDDLRLFNYSLDGYQVMEFNNSRMNKLPFSVTDVADVWQVNVVSSDGIDYSSISSKTITVLNDSCNAGWVNAYEDFQASGVVNFCPSTILGNDSNGDGFVNVTSSNTVLNCQGGTWRGNYTSGSLPFNSSTFTGVSVIDCNFENYAGNAVLGQRTNLTNVSWKHAGNITFTGENVVLRSNFTFLLLDNYSRGMKSSNLGLNWTMRNVRIESNDSNLFWFMNMITTVNLSIRDSYIAGQSAVYTGAVQYRFCGRFCEIVNNTFNHNGNIRFLGQENDPDTTAHRVLFASNIVNDTAHIEFQRYVSSLGEIKVRDNIINSTFLSPAVLNEHIGAGVPIYNDRIYNAEYVNNTIHTNYSNYAIDFIGTSKNLSVRDNNIFLYTSTATGIAFGGNTNDSSLGETFMNFSEILRNRVTGDLNQSGISLQHTYYSVVKDNVINYTIRTGSTGSCMILSFYAGYNDLRNNTLINCNRAAIRPAQSFENNFTGNTIYTSGRYDYFLIDAVGSRITDNIYANGSAVYTLQSNSSILVNESTNTSLINFTSNGGAFVNFTFNGRKIFNATDNTTYIYELASPQDDVRYSNSSNTLCANSPNCNVTLPFGFSAQVGAFFASNISSPVVWAVGTSAVSLNFTPDIATNFTIFYGTSPSISNLFVNTTIASGEKAVRLQNLQTNTLYYFNVSVCDVAVCTSFGGFNFTTALDDGVGPGAGSGGGGGGGSSPPPVAPPPVVVPPPPSGNASEVEKNFFDGLTKFFEEKFTKQSPVREINAGPFKVELRIADEFVIDRSNRISFKIKGADGSVMEAQGLEFIIPTGGEARLKVTGFVRSSSGEYSTTFTPSQVTPGEYAAVINMQVEGQTVQSDAVSVVMSEPQMSIFERVGSFFGRFLSGIERFIIAQRGG